MYRNLRIFRESIGLSQKDFAKALGIGQTTYNGYETGARDPKSDFWIKVAETFHVSVDYLMGYEGTKKAPGIKPEAMKVAREYEKLDEHGQRVVRSVLDEELLRMDAEKAPQVMKTVPLMQPLAAGIAEPTHELEEERIEVPPDSRADFAIRVNGTSMEPYLHDGSIALGVLRRPRDGEVGAFLLGGEFVVKQYIDGGFGGYIYLFSANRNEADKDIVLTQEKAKALNLTYFGTILTDKKVPRPLA